MNRPHAGRWPCCALMWLTVISVSPWVAAEDTSPSRTEQLVVMRDGRILQGVVQRHAVGYYVERSNGSILVPQEQVRCVARDLADAYRLQREQMLDPTSADLLRLAEWCISYRLYDEAQQELKRALRREPDNDTARRMLAKLEDRLMASPQLAAPRARVDQLGLVMSDVESLGGLSKELAMEFTSRIQPLLINKCGNAACHGFSSRSDFRLTHVRNGSANHRLSSQQNLALVLKQIDLSNPKASPILQRTQGAHGGATFAIFSGAGGTAQRQTLENWVFAVVKEQQKEAEQLANRSPLKPTKAKVNPTDEATETASTQVQPAKFETTVAPAIAESMHLQSLGEEAPSSPSEPATRPRRNDAFDPEEFNRLYGGQPAPRTPGI